MLIALKNISFSYGGPDVIRDLSLEIGRGEIVGILGPNGAGKSTLIKIMSGIFKPKSGKVLLDGKDIALIPHRERAETIATVPQMTDTPFSFTAMEVVLMARATRLPIFGFESEDDIRIAKEAMEMTSSFEFASRNLGSLSGGERQRVILARAFAQQTPIILLDEPATFLDIRHQIELNKLLSEQNKKQGLTIISALHDLNMAAAFCNRVILVKDGNVFADGLPNQVMTTDNIFSVFGAKVKTIEDPKNGRSYCLPV